MSITFTAGDEWWLERRTRGKARRQRYPKSIVVGPDPDNGRRYVPERTCHMLPTRSASYCTVHQVMGGNRYDMDFGYSTCSECGAEVFDCPTVKYCPNCGAKVVNDGN